jgi:hypothetical protein
VVNGLILVHGFKHKGSVKPTSKQEKKKHRFVQLLDLRLPKFGRLSHGKLREFCGFSNQNHPQLDIHQPQLNVGKHCSSSHMCRFRPFRGLSVCIFVDFPKASNLKTSHRASEAIMISQDMALEILLFIAALLPRTLACLDMFNETVDKPGVETPDYCDNPQ